MKKGESFQRVKISEEEYELLKSEERKIKSIKLLKRIQAFKFIYLGWTYSAIAEFLSVTNNTITNWISLYNVGGIAKLLTLEYKGGQAKLSEVQLSELKEKAGEGSFVFAKDVRHYIEKNFGIKFNLSHVQLMCKKNFIYPLRRPD